MIIRFFALTLVLATVTLSTNVIAKKIAIYRWVDENNVVHFSQHQPQGDNYSELTTVSSYNAQKKQPTVTNTERTSLNEQVAKFEREQEEIKAKNEEIVAQNCKAAQLNLKMLNSFNQVLTTDADGNNKLLTEKEKKEQIALSKKHVDLYCKKATPLNK